MKIAFLDVGHGNCTIVHSGHVAIVIDCPSGSAPTVLSYLFREGIREIAHLVVSHGHKDHCGLAPMLMKSDDFQVGRVWLLDDQTNPSRAYLDIRRAFGALRNEGRSLARGYPHAEESALALEPDGLVRFVYPFHDERMGGGKVNHFSVIVRVESPQNRGVALVPGDSDATALLGLLDAGTDISAHWLVAPHHGGKLGEDSGPTEDQAVLDRLIRATQASEVLFSIGRSQYRLPRPDVVEVVMRHEGVRPRCTQLSENCCEDHEMREVADAFHEPGGRGHRPERNWSCAGSVVVDLVDNPSWASSSKHDVFVDEYVARPMCRKLVTPTA
jgi:beta-lactamase superfamily II metal-dependent hydrolase